jgi:hypothetical protein
LLLGSVSNAVIRHAHCPVMVIREAGRRTETSRLAAAKAA